MDAGDPILIIGGGAWGLSAALALAEGGHRRVTVWDLGRTGTGATGVGAGLVSTHLRQESDIRLVLETIRRIHGLVEWGTAAQRPSAQHAFHPVGCLTIAPAGDAFRLENLDKRVRRCGAGGELLRGEALGRWPIRGAKNFVGFLTQGDGYVVSGDLFDLVRARCESLGVRFEHERSAQLDVKDGRCVGIRSGAEVFEASRVLVAAGAWSKRVLAAAGLPLPVKPYRTQLAAVDFVGGDELPVLHDMEQRTYSRPDGPDRLLVGDGTQFVESEPDAFDRNPDPPFIQKVARSLTRRFTGVDAARYRKGWAGLCVSTPDREPILGPDPRVKGLHLMVGDNGFGVMRSLALGFLAAERLQGRMLPGLDRYAPKRLDFGADFPIREGFELD